MDDPHDLERFWQAQDGTYERVLEELHGGRKRSHWMWFVFPQIAGLGSSAMSRRYAIQGPDEARAYLEHPVLGARLRECCEVLLEPHRLSAVEVFGPTDALKLRSCATLFAAVSPAGSIFHRVLDEYFGGEQDRLTTANIGGI